MIDTQPKHLWYREPLVWLIIAIPLSAVVVGIIMLSLAITTYDGLVVDDYYVRGKEINRTLYRDRRAAAIGLSARVVLDYRDSELDVLLAADAPLDTSDAIDLDFLHPVTAGQDHRVRLAQISASTFRGSLPVLTPGKWMVQLGNATWRLAGSIRIPEQTSFTLHADQTNR